MKCVEGEKTSKKVLEAVRAIEMHMILSCIAMGILQSLSIHYIGKVSSSQIRYQRTLSRGRVSETILMHYFQKHFFRLLGQKPEKLEEEIRLLLSDLKRSSAPSTFTPGQIMAIINLACKKPCDFGYEVSQ